MNLKLLASIPVLVFLANLTPLNAAPNSSDQQNAAAVAEKFINAYVQAIPSFHGYMGAVAWVKKQPLASPNFKKLLEALYRQALREDPEIGYGADAVLGAQDYPDAFQVKSVGLNGDKATVDLVGTPPFPMPLRMILIRNNDSWLVDASGDLIE
jgi:hypothetical protein